MGELSEQGWVYVLGRKCVCILGECHVSYFEQNWTIHTDMLTLIMHSTPSFDVQSRSTLSQPTFDPFQPSIILVPLEYHHFQQLDFAGSVANNLNNYSCKL